MYRRPYRGEEERALQIIDDLSGVDVRIRSYAGMVKSLKSHGKQDKIGEMMDTILGLDKETGSESVRVDVVEALTEASFLDRAIDRARDIFTSEEKALALSYIASNTTEEPFLSEDLLDTLDMIEKKRSYREEKIESDLRDIAQKIAASKSRRSLIKTIDGFTKI